MRKSNEKYRRGVTLVEILLVISIMAVLTALIIPKVRVVNKDRKIRETARVVGSMFATASQNAVTKKIAGVIVERNPNFVADDNVQFVATTLFASRGIPDYSPHFLMLPAHGHCRCQRDPVAWDPNSIRPMQPNDYIYVNNQNFGYRIKTVDETFADPSDPDFDSTFPFGAIDLTVDFFDGPGARSGLPMPGMIPGGVPFRVVRQPRKIENSRIDLPSGYQIDLRFSGELDQNTGSKLIANNQDIHFVFNEMGAINQVLVGTESYLPGESLYLLVAEDGLDLDQVAHEDNLTNAENLWVVVQRADGAASVNYNQPQSSPVDPTDPVERFNRVKSARGLAVNRTNAHQ